jgi:hypothetical protein
MGPTRRAAQTAQEEQARPKRKAEDGHEKRRSSRLVDAAAPDDGRRAHRDNDPAAQQAKQKGVKRGSRASEQQPVAAHAAALLPRPLPPALALCELAANRAPPPPCRLPAAPRSH